MQCQQHFLSDFNRVMRKASCSPKEREEIGSLVNNWLHSKSSGAAEIHRDQIYEYKLGPEFAGFFKHAVGKSGFLLDCHRHPYASRNSGVECHFSTDIGSNYGNLYEAAREHVMNSAVLACKHKYMEAGKYLGGKGPGVVDFQSRADTRKNGAEFGYTLCI
jgi:hypothetical protein